MKAKLFFTSLAFTLPLIPTSAEAFEWMNSNADPSHWPNSITWNGIPYAKYAAVADSSYFYPLTSTRQPIERISLQNAMSVLNKLPSKLRYQVSYKTFDPTNGDGKFGNQKNEIWFEMPSTTNHLSAGVLAYTSVKTKVGDYRVIKEADVVFNKNYLSGFEFSQNKNKLHIWKLSTDGKYSFMATAMHELGHVAGAHHYDGEANMMGLTHAGKRSDGKTSGYHAAGSMGIDIQTNDPIKLARPLTGKDFANGIINAYGIDPAKTEDVSISPWKRYGNEKDCSPDPCVGYYYSLHSRKALLYDEFGDQVIPVTSAVDPLYMRSDPIFGPIQKNKVYQATFVYENTGKSPSLDVAWRAYVSVDDVLNTATDRSLESGAYGAGVLTLKKYNQQSVYPKFKLPTDLANNTVYYIFIALDPDNLITEGNEQDNYTYVKIRTAP